MPSAYRQWVTIVTNYSKGQLTEESDRLIALYGVAQWMKQKLIHDEYIAGLWKGHLLNQLLWMTYPNLKKRRPDKYRAPSWSWASVIGKVSFRDILEAEEQEKTARVVEVKVDSAKGKEGQITGGSLKIHSKAVEVTWTSWELARSKPSSSVRTGNNEFAWPWNDEWTTNPSENFSFNIEGKIFNFTGFPDVEPDGFQNGETLCIAIQKSTETKESTGTLRETTGTGTWSCIVEGLVLKEDGIKTFKRIGCFVAYGDGAKYFLEKSTKREVEIS